MYFTYRVEEVFANTTTKTYLERMDHEGRVLPLLPDQIAYVTTEEGGRYSIANSAGEVFFVGTNGIKGMTRDLKLLRPAKILVNGADFEAYRIASSALVYFVYIRRSRDRNTYFVAIEKTREGVHQDVKTFCGSLEDVQKGVKRYLRRVRENYYVHYINRAYRLPGVQERQLLREFMHDTNTIRDALRAHVAEWKEKQQHEAEEAAAAAR